MDHRASNDALRAAPTRELTLDEVDAIAGGMTNHSGGLAPDPHKPDLLQILLTIIKNLG